jgi:hypothetical protein
MSNFFGTVAKDLVGFAKKLKAGILTVAKDAPKVIADIQKDEGAIEDLTGFLAPGAVQVEELAFNALGVLAHAVEDAGAAALANGLDVTLDQALVSDIRTLLPFLKSHAAKSGLTPTPSTVAAK